MCSTPNPQGGFVQISPWHTINPHGNGGGLTPDPLKIKKKGGGGTRFHAFFFFHIFVHYFPPIQVIDSQCNGSLKVELFWLKVEFFWIKRGVLLERTKKQIKVEKCFVVFPFLFIFAPGIKTLGI